MAAKERKVVREQDRATPQRRDEHALKSKRVSKRHQPKGLVILHEDKDIVVVEKSAGLLTIGTAREKTSTAYYRLTDYVRKGNSKSRERVFIVHRLDREVSGLLVFARNVDAKTALQEQWDGVKKGYAAVVHGAMTPKAGTLSSYLEENRTLVVRSTEDVRKGKLSHTAYKVVKEGKGFSLLSIELLTGRKHQIRVQLAEHGNPIVGDKKYGRADGHKRLALHATKLAFLHPYSGERMVFESKAPGWMRGLTSD